MTRTTACERMLSAISSYLDGDLDAATCVEIEQHCGGCADCSRVVAALRQTVGLCHDAAGAPLPEGVRARARDSVRRLLLNEPPS